MINNCLRAKIDFVESFQVKYIRQNKRLANTKNLSGKRIQASLEVYLFLFSVKVNRMQFVCSLEGPMVLKKFFSLFRQIRVMETKQKLLVYIKGIQ